MNGKFLLPSSKRPPKLDPFADKSSLIIDWLLRNGIAKTKLSIREVAREINLSHGLVQKVFEALVRKGYLITKGERTAKVFILKRPQQLLKDWIESYSIVDKCRLRTYRSGIRNRKQLLAKISEAGLQSKVKFALHSAAQTHGWKNTNLSTLELYMLEPDVRKKLEEILLLEPSERGYEVLLIEPYYKSMLKNEFPSKKKPLQCSSPLLTFLDLYHFPLRGIEQAEFMAENIPELKQLYHGQPHGSRT